LTVSFSSAHPSHSFRINALLSERGPLVYDVSLEPGHIRLWTGSSLQAAHRDQLATSPSLSSLAIACPERGVRFSVSQQTVRGVTVGDVLDSLWYVWGPQSPRNREKLGGQQHAPGKMMFQGLKPGTNNTWILCLGPDPSEPRSRSSSQSSGAH